MAGQPTCDKVIAVVSRQRHLERGCVVCDLQAVGRLTLWVQACMWDARQLLQ